MFHLTRHPRFATDDQDEYIEAARRLLDREVELLVSDIPFHFAVHTATMELLTVSVVEVSEGTSIHQTNAGYSLARVELGSIERRVKGFDHVFTPGTGYFATPDRKAEMIKPYSSGNGTVSSVVITLPEWLIQSTAETLIGERAKQPLEIPARWT